MAVTLSDPNTIDRKNRFLGICIRREREGLKHQFTLRNVIDGLGDFILSNRFLFLIPNIFIFDCPLSSFRSGSYVYEMYNPTILKIETIRLEKRLDDDLSYLIDALPEYSRFDIHMEPVAHTIGKPVPINETKVIFFIV